MTNHGIAYYHVVKKPPISSTLNPPILPNANPLNNSEQVIALILPNPEVCLVKDGTSKHIYPVIYEDDKYFYTCGYFTGSKGGVFLHETKFADYQRKQEGLPLINSNEKNKILQNSSNYYALGRKRL